MRTLIAALALAGMTSAVWGHDSWISRNGLKNAAGEWCCGAGDCGRVVNPKRSISVTPAGYRVNGLVMYRHGDGRIRYDRIDETVPYSEAQPSLDGYHRCKRPDGSRRCFFRPVPSM